MTVIDIDKSISEAIITSTPPAHLSDIPIKETPSRPSKSRSRSQSLGSTKQVEKDNTFRIYRPVQCGPPFVFPERKADTMNKEEEKHPAYSLVKPPKSSVTALDLHKKTLGRLFTDGGLEDFLIRVVLCADRRDLASCLLVRWVILDTT